MSFDSIVNSQIGLRLRARREAQGLSRERLAEAADMSVQFLADIETGRKGMTVQTLRKLVLALHCSADELLFEQPENTTGAKVVLARRVLSMTNAQAEMADKILDMVLELLPDPDAHS